MMNTSPVKGEELKKGSVNVPQPSVVDVNLLLTTDREGISPEKPTVWFNIISVQ